MGGKDWARPVDCPLVGGCGAGRAGLRLEASKLLDASKAAKWSFNACAMGGTDWARPVDCPFGGG